MNLEQLIAAAKAKLVALKSRIEAGEDAAIEEAEQAMTELADLEAKKAKADEWSAKIKSIGSVNSGTKDAGQDSPKRGTLGQKAADAVAKGGYVKGNRVSLTVDHKDTTPTPATQVRPTSSSDALSFVSETRDQWVMQPRRRLTIADLFAQETTDKGYVEYFVESATMVGSITTVAEGGAYPQVEFGIPTKKTDAIKKIGCIYKDSAELLDDGPRLASAIDDQAMYRMDIVEEDQLLKGDGTGSNLTGLLNVSGLQTKSYAKTATVLDIIEAIKSCKPAITKMTPRFRADALLVNDEDWDAITSLKDSNNQYMAAGPFSGAYGNAQILGEEPPLWGLRIVATQAVPKDTYVVGAFKLGGSVIRRGGRNVEVTNSDGTDFEKDIIAFKPSERLTLAVRYPAAFVKLTRSAT